MASFPNLAKVVSGAKISRMTEDYIVWNGRPSKIDEAISAIEKEEGVVFTSPQKEEVTAAFGRIEKNFK